MGAMLADPPAVAEELAALNGRLETAIERCQAPHLVALADRVYSALLRMTCRARLESYEGYGRALADFDGALEALFAAAD